MMKRTPAKLFSLFTLTLILSVLSGCGQDNYVSSAADLDAPLITPPGAPQEAPLPEEADPWGEEESLSLPEPEPDSNSALDPSPQLPQTDLPNSSGPAGYIEEPDNRPDELVSVGGNPDFGVPLEEDGEPQDSFDRIPGIQLGSAEFRSLFDQNTIDQQYNQEIQLAASLSKFQEIILTTQNAWINSVSPAYEAALAAYSDPGQKATLQEDQEEWVAQLNDQLSELRNAQEDRLLGEYRVLRHYRLRAAQLLSIVYENTGSFDEPTGAFQGVG